MNSVPNLCRAVPSVVCWLAAVLVATPGPGQPPPIVNAINQQQEPMTYQIFRQVEEAAEAAENSDDPVLTEEHFGHDHDAWMDLFKVTRSDNPLVDPACRQEAMERTIEVTGNPGAVEKHIKARTENWNEVRQGKHEVRLSEYLGHLRECTRVCGPYVSGLLSCHVEGGRRRSHMIVHFGVGRPRASEADRFSFSPDDANQMREFSERMKGQGKELLLLSRASMLHANEKVQINQLVAQRRADAVEHFLIDSGYPMSQIRKKVLAWEPPRLDAYEMAQAYGVDGDWLAQPNKQYMDQSVVLVAF